MAILFPLHFHSENATVRVILSISENHSNYSNMGVGISFATLRSMFDEKFLPWKTRSQKQIYQNPLVLHDLGAVPSSFSFEYRWISNRFPATNLSFCSAEAQVQIPITCSYHGHSHLEPKGISAEGNFISEGSWVILSLTTLSKHTNEIETRTNSRNHFLSSAMSRFCTHNGFSLTQRLDLSCTLDQAAGGSKLVLVRLQS